MPKITKHGAIGGYPLVIARVEPTRHVHWNESGLVKGYAAPDLLTKKRDRRAPTY